MKILWFWAIKQGELSSKIKFKSKISLKCVKLLEAIFHNQI
jgi:hypothetical protein